MNRDGTHAVVIKVDRPSTVIIEGLPPAAYRTEYTTGKESSPEMSTAGDAPLTVRIPDRGVLTVFSRTPEAASR